MIEVDGVRVENVDLSADGDTILYEVTDNEDQHQLPTPYGVLDRETGRARARVVPARRQPGRAGPAPGPSAPTATSWCSPDRSRRDRSGPRRTCGTVEAGVTTMVSRNDADQPANDGAFPVDVSADGRYVLFGSSATNLTDQDIMQCGTNGSQPCEQLYLRDVEAGTTTLVSTDPDGTARGGHYWADLTDDGRYVAFESRDELLLWDREVGGTEVLDVTTDGAEAEQRDLAAPPHRGRPLRDLQLGRRQRGRGRHQRRPSTCSATTARPARPSW